MRIRQQVISTVRIFTYTSSFQFFICHGYEAIIQIGNGIVCFLAGPYCKFNGVDPSLFQRTYFAKVPGHAVRFVIGRTRSSWIIFTCGTFNPFCPCAARRCDVILKSACVAGSNICAHVRERRDTVVYSDIASSHTGNDLSCNLAESFLQGSLAGTINRTCSVGVSYHIIKVVITTRGSAEDSVKNCISSKSVRGILRIWQCCGIQVISGAGSGMPLPAVRRTVCHENNVCRILTQIRIAESRFGNSIAPLEATLPVRSHGTRAFRKPPDRALHLSSVLRPI